MAVVLLPFALLFVLSILVGAWLRRRSQRGPWRSIWPWPAAMSLLTMAALAALVVRSGPNDEFLDLGLIAITMMGTCATALAWAGAMAGAMWMTDR